MVLHSLVILKFLVILLFILFYQEMLDFFFSEICGYNIILPFPIITPINYIVCWNSCILLLLIIIPCSSNFNII